MHANDMITARQFMILAALYGVGDSILYIPELLAADSGQDAWIASAIGFIDAILLAYLYGKLGGRFPGVAFTQYTQILLGKWVGKLVLLGFTLYVFIDTILMLYEIGDFMLTQFVPRTPIQAVMLIFLLIIIQGTRIGPGPLVRSAEIFFPWAAFLLVVLAVALLPQIQVDKLRPIFEHGPSLLLKSNGPQLAFMAEAVILLIIFPHIDMPAKGTKALLQGFLLSNFVLFILTLLSIMVLGAELSTNLLFPGYTLATKIDVGHFVTRIEAILATIWFITIFVKTTVCFHATSVVFSQVLQLGDYRPLIWPLGVLMIACAILCVPTSTYYESVISPFWTSYSIMNGILLPLVLLLLSAVRKKHQAASVQPRESK